MLYSKLRADEVKNQKLTSFRELLSELSVSTTCTLTLFTGHSLSEQVVRTYYVFTDCLVAEDVLRRH